MESRFSAANLQLAKSITCVLQCDPVGSQLLINKYRSILNIDPDITINEMNILLMTYDNQPTISEVKSKLVENGKFYPNYYKLYQLALSIPTGSVKCERSISVLRRINCDYNNIK